MKKFSLTTLLASAVLFVTMGATALNAEAMKCGAGKCGAAMEKPACCQPKAGELKKPACCEAKAIGKACECGPEVKCECKDKNNCTCGAKKAPVMKCGAGKCGAAMQKPACCEAKAIGNACKCGPEVKCDCKDKNNCTCGVKKAPKEAMKCGTGKCG